MKTNIEHSKFREHRLVLLNSPQTTPAPEETPEVVQESTAPPARIEKKTDVPAVAVDKRTQAASLADKAKTLVKENSATENDAARDVGLTATEGKDAADTIESAVKVADPDAIGEDLSPNALNASPPTTPNAKIVKPPEKPNAPKTGSETGEEGAEKAPETIGDQLFKHLDDAGEESAKAAEKLQNAQKKLKEAGDDPAKKSAAEADIREAQNEQFKAFAKSFAAVLAIFKSVFDGSFSNAIKAGKTETGAVNAPNQTAGGNSLSSRPTGSPAQTVQREVAQQNPRNAEETQRALTKTREEKEKSMESNTKAIDSLIVKRETIEDGSKALIDQRGEVEKQLIDLRKEDGQENEVFELETELERINGQITANEKAINKINKRIDDLKKENENLKKEIDAATNIKKDLEEVMKRLTPFMENLAKMNGLAKEKITITLDSNGYPVIKIDINGAADAAKTQIVSLGTPDAETGTVTVSEKSIAAPAKPAETPIINDLGPGYDPEFASIENQGLAPAKPADDAETPANETPADKKADPEDAKEVDSERVLQIRNDMAEIIGRRSGLEQKEQALVKNALSIETTESGKHIIKVNMQLLGKGKFNDAQKEVITYGFHPSSNASNIKESEEMTIEELEGYYARFITSVNRAMA